MEDNFKKILFLSKETAFCNYAQRILKSYFDKENLLILTGKNNERLPPIVFDHSYDFIISFLSPWIVPENLLLKSKVAAINFHPGSPNYPGIGCYNFAIYEQTGLYGVTCHHMLPKVDTGSIILTSYFDMAPNETVETLKIKSMNHLLLLFQKTLSLIYNNRVLPSSRETWKRKAFTRRQLDELCKINLDDDDETLINLKIRATTYSDIKYGPYVVVNNEKIYLVSDKHDQPLA